MRCLIVVWFLRVITYFPKEANWLLLEIDEELTAALADGVQAAVDAHAVQLLQTAAVELEDLEAWGDVPDVAEGNLGKLAAPLSSHADSTAQGHEHVAAFLAAVEAFV